MSRLLTLDIQRLILDCRAARDRMSAKNTHKSLLFDIEMALIALWQERREHLLRTQPDAPTQANR